MRPFSPHPNTCYGSTNTTFKNNNNSHDSIPFHESSQSILFVVLFLLIAIKSLLNQSDVTTHMGMNEHSKYIMKSCTAHIQP